MADELNNVEQRDVQHQPERQNIEVELRAIVKTHFVAARARVGDVSKGELLSARSIARRHWQYRRDIPRDLVSMPRTVWRGMRGLLRRSGPEESGSPKVLSGMEAAMLIVIRNDLLDLPGLQFKLHERLLEADPQLDDAQALLQELAGEDRLDAVERYLAGELERLSTPSEGTRDLLVFMLIGVISRGSGLNATFGSALAAGSATASAVYVASQSWWGALWLQFSGMPAWVSVAGAVGGLGVAVVLTPALAPLSEWLVNRWRGERYLHDLVDQVEHNLLENRKDGLDLAGRLAGLAQFAPDLLALLRAIR
ncbi:hypothetical protein [Allohahella marinimesophila]|uniref:Uncharacterized protein n=1 Tax=Allohahella marinimesophila TaxID=1054972 RepID=A0ABP7NI75_9GAMM